MSEDSSFFSRWSRRKAQVQRGEAARVEVPPAPAAAPAPAPAPAPPAPAVALPAATAAAPASSEPPPTLDDARRLTPQSADFSRFVRPGVDPGVRHTALKTLFADPHFNVMDGLDVYIDDYNTPDPLPATMLRQMVQSRMLGLFDDETEQAAEPPAPPADEDPDLRLQPDDAAGRAEPGAGPGEDPGRQP